MHVGLPVLKARHAIASALASGGLLWLAFPPTGWWPLAFAGVALLSIASAGRGRRGAFGIGLLAGLAFFLPLIDWLQNVGLHAWLVLAVTQAIATGLLGVALAHTSRLSWWPVAHAGLWVGYEALRGRYPLGGFTWGRLAFSQTRGPLVRLAAIGGAPLVSFATGLVGLLLLWVALTVRGDGVRRWRALAPAVAVLALVAVGSLGVPLPIAGARTLTVAAVQGNVPALGLDSGAEDLVVVSNHAAATTDLARKVTAGKVRAPDLVVWPESSTDIDPRSDAQVRALVADAAGAIRAPILVGGVLDTDGGRFLNAGLIWDPVAGPGQIYAKQHLVPFGEYVPWRGLLGNRISMLNKYIPRNYTRGTRPGVFDVAGARVGDVICFEVAYDGLVRDTVKAGAQLLVVQTNNATYMRGRDPAQTEQQLEMARLRAVEHGRAVIVAATSGVSALIGPDGSTLARSGVFTQEELVAALPLRSALSVADRVGGWPEALICALALAAIALASRPRAHRGPHVRSSAQERSSALERAQPGGARSAPEPGMVA